MKIVIVTEGGKNIGFGHITRCISLYQAFEEQGVKPELVINGDVSISTVLDGKDCKVLNWLIEKEKLLMILKDTDIVIIDSYLGDAVLYNEISGICKNVTLVMIDDYMRMDYPKGIVVNPSIYGDKLNYPKKDDMFYLTGKDYIILRSEFWNLPKKPIAKKIRQVLITFGGMNYADLMARVIEYLKARFDFNFRLVDSGQHKVDSGTIVRLMLESDLCISGGGQTINELIRAGVPTIGICLSENQRRNLEAWHEKGIIEYAGHCDDMKLLENIEAGIKKLASQKSRLEISDLGRTLIDGQGPRRLVKEILVQHANKN